MLVATVMAMEECARCFFSARYNHDGYNDSGIVFVFVCFIDNIALRTSTENVSHI